MVLVPFVLVKANPYHDKRGRFTHAPGGRRDKVRMVGDDPGHINKLLGKLKADGGFTVDPVSARSSHIGYAVAIDPSRSLHKKASELTDGDVAEWQVKNADLLSKRGAKIGGWLDTETGDVWLDVVQVKRNLNAAKVTGIKANQIAVFDLANMNEIRIGGTGEAVQKGKKQKRVRLAVFDADADPATIVAWAQGHVSKHSPGGKPHNQKSHGRGGGSSIAVQASDGALDFDSFGGHGATYRDHATQQKAIEEFDALPDNAKIAVYHGTTAENASSLEAGGGMWAPGFKNSMGSLPTVDKGSYVAPTFDDAMNYGNTVVRMVVPKSAMTVSSEYGRPGGTLGQSFMNSSSGAVIPPGTKPLSVAVMTSKGTKPGGGGKSQAYGANSGKYVQQSFTNDEEFDQLNAAGQRRYNELPVNVSHRDAMYHAFYGGADNTGLRKATDADVTKLNTELKAAGEGPIPPAWRYVMISERGIAGTDKGLIAKGVAANGKVQPKYSTKKREAQAADKFDRFDGVARDVGKLDKALARDAMTDPTAGALMVIRKTGMRAGSPLGSVRAKEQAFGATTLQAKHVKIDGDTVRFNFTGKKGVNIRLNVKDPELAKVVSAHKGSKTHSAPVFEGASQKKALAYVKANMGDYKVHDLRTLRANSVAAQVKSRWKGKPRNKTEFNKRRNEIGDKVSAALGNTRAEALKSYVNPAIFADWQV